MFANALRIPVAVAEQKLLAPGKLLHCRHQPEQEPILVSRASPVRRACVTSHPYVHRGNNFSLGALPPAPQQEVKQ